VLKNQLIPQVRQNWSSGDQITSKYPSLKNIGLHQVNECIAIGLKCVEVDRNKIPSIVDIVSQLKGGSSTNF
jgi:hypothetical protein